MGYTSTPEGDLRSSCAWRRIRITQRPLNGQETGHCTLRASDQTINNYGFNGNEEQRIILAEALLVKKKTQRLVGTITSN